MSTSEQNTDREKEIFNEALGMPSVEAREAFLKGACGHDAALRQRMESLLSAYDSAENFIPTKEAWKTLPAEGSVTETPGMLIGRYKLLQKIGEGGMGVVYMAEQTEPVTRKVALKIIKLGMDTKQVVARFEAERQALAMMDHPNIARVLDAGATETGRPYFVMELVRGVPITEYCDKNKLSAKERLQLFIPVCQAIQHAHQKGVIHRDIKPSNIMVTLHDGSAVPKVIDFGIAKATNQKLTEKTLFTNYAQMIGTPAYMSPEQAEMSGLDVDTRTDVYALGVLLYELLTGTTPFPSKELLSMGYGEMQKIIAEKDPPKPSTRMSTMQNEERTVVAKNRSMEVSALGKLFQGDLDWIVMKALEKDRTHRYETVNGLATDIQRHLNNEPVSAAARTFGYQLRKFARRNQKYARLAAAIAALLLIAALTATWQAVRATRAQHLALAAQRAAMRERETAQTRALEAEAARTGEREAKQQAEHSAEEARANERHAMRLLYASDMREVQRALKREDRQRAIQLLESHIPKEADPDFRDWEWRYLWAATRGDSFTNLGQFSSSIHSLAVSQDGRFLAVGRSTYMSTNALTVIDLATNRRVPGVPVPAHGRVRVAFSPGDGLLAFNRRMRVDQKGDEIVLWDSTSQKTITQFTLTGSCEGLHFSQDGRTLFVSHLLNSDSQILRWDVLDRTLRPPWPAPGFRADLGMSESFTIDAAGNLAAYTSISPSGGWQVKLMDLNSGKILWSTDPTPSDSIMAIALSPDGQWLATCDGYGVEIPVLWNARTGEKLSELEGHADYVKEFLFWPDGKKLATASKDQTIRIWDISNPQQPSTIRILRGHRRAVWQLALGPDERTLYSGAQAGRVLSWDSEAIRDWNTETILTQEISSDDWFFEEGGRSIVALNLQSQVVRFSGKNYEKREVLFEVEPELTPYNAFSHNRKFLAVAHLDGRAVIWDVKSGEKIHEKQISSGPIGIVLMKNDGTIVLGQIELEGFGIGVAHWDLSQSSPLWSKTFKTGTPPFCVESTNEEWLLLPHDAREQRGLLINQKLGTPGLPITGVGVSGWAVFSPDSTYFAVDGTFRNATIFETATRRPVLPISDNLPQIKGGAFSHDNRRFAAGGNEINGFSLWDFETGQVVISFADGRLSYYGIGYSSDGNLIGAQSDGQLHIWRAPTWEEVRAVGERDRLPERTSPY